MNPLMSQASAPPTMQATQGPQNPMAQQTAGAAPQPLSAAALAASMTPQQLVKGADLATYSAQEFAALAKKPDLSSKDVVNSAGQAVADGKITASDAVEFLSGMPQDEQNLRPWVDGLAMHYLTGSVHLKAAMLKQGLMR